MANTIKRWMERKKVLKQRRLKEWKVSILNNEHYQIKAPYWIDRRHIQTSGDEENQCLVDWANIELKFLSSIHQQIPKPHSYMRLFTYYLPKNIMNLSTKIQIETISIKEEKAYLFLIPDCQENFVWETFLKTGTALDMHKMMFTLDYQPEDWREVLGNIFEIAEKDYKLKPIEENKNELSGCRFLCYWVDGNPVIAKSDLSEKAILSILEDIALEKNLELVVERNS
jgi:hypothetical protein